MIATAGPTEPAESPQDALDPIPRAEPGSAADGPYSGPAGHPGPTASPVVLEAERWKVDTSHGSVKGIAEADAREAATRLGGTVFRSWVRLHADGTEVLGPWARVDGEA